MQRSNSPVMTSHSYWEENGQSVKYENFNSNDGFSRQSDPALNFATSALPSEDDGEYGAHYLKKGKVSRQQDPMSHRIIEKRRRDRMNNCLADLSRLIPPDYLKKGRGRVEKTEIIEMAIRRLKNLQERTNGADTGEKRGRGGGPISLEHYRLGYQECRSEVMRYLVEGQGYLPTDSLCVHLLGHLHRHCDSITTGNQINQPRSNPETTNSSSSSGNYAADTSVIMVPTAPEPNNNDFHPSPHEDASFTPSDLQESDYLSVPYYCDDEPLSLTRDSPSALRSVRKLDAIKPEEPEHAISYKFKNNIKQRFSQDCDEARDMSVGKRRKLDSPKARSFNSSHDEGVCPDAELSETPPPDEPRPEPPPLPTLSQVSPNIPPDSKLANLCVPVFALNALGKYYVPLNVTYDCLASFLGPYDLLQEDGTGKVPLHPVSINVNFQPYLEQLTPSVTPRQWAAE